MFKVLIDTCVWLDLAKDPKQYPVLGVIEQMVRQKLIELVVPEIVLDEFRRNIVSGSPRTAPRACRRI